jgi:glucokinase
MMKVVAVGVDIGGTSVKLGIVDTKGKILMRDNFSTKELKGRAAMMDKLVERVKFLTKEARSRGMKVKGVGVGAPGPIEVEKGFVYTFPNIPGWNNTPFKAILEKKLKMPVRIDNDANAMALGESMFGAGKGARSVVALTLGTGIGGGIVLDGKLFHGRTYSAAEIGHMTINEDGPLCGCGNRGCVETYVGNGYFSDEVKRRLKAGAKSILSKWIKEGKTVTPLLVKQAAWKGDKFALKMWEDTGSHLATALAALANILNPDRFVIGGGVAQQAEVLFRPLMRSFKRKAFPIAVRSVKVMPAKLGAEAGLIGAAALILA